MSETQVMTPLGPMDAEQLLKLQMFEVLGAESLRQQVAAQRLVLSELRLTAADMRV